MTLPDCSMCMGDAAASAHRCPRTGLKQGLTWCREQGPFRHLEGAQRILYHTPLQAFRGLQPPALGAGPWQRWDSGSSVPRLQWLGRPCPAEPCRHMRDQSCTRNLFVRLCEECMQTTYKQVKNSNAMLRCCAGIAQGCVMLVLLPCTVQAGTECQPGYINSYSSQAPHCKVHIGLLHWYLNPGLWGSRILRPVWACIFWVVISQSCSLFMPCRAPAKPSFLVHMPRSARKLL